MVPRTNYSTAQLRDNLARFVFLLGGDGGESLFAPPSRASESGDEGNGS